MESLDSSINIETRRMELRGVIRLAGGVIAQSGYIPHEAGLEIDEVGVRNKPFLLTHGIQDPMLPVDWARRSRDTLRALGVALEYHEFNMGHQVTAESLDVISAWLEKQLEK